MIVLLHVAEDLRVYSSREECDLGLDHGRVEVVSDTGDDRFRLTVGGRSFRSLWSWTTDTKRPGGAVPFLALPRPWT